MIDLNSHFESIKSILCLNGEIPSKHFFMRYPNLPIIAADGATNTLLKMGINPSIIIGDFDSIDKTIVPKQTEAFHQLEQNTTDFEKCLHVIAKRKLFPCLIYGATGKESDHTLYNISVIAAHSLHSSIIFHDSAYREKEKYGVFVTDYLVGDLPIGSKISLFSFLPSIVSTRGLTWELNKMSLLHQTSSARNIIKSNPIEITVHNGNVLVMFDLE